MADAIKEKLHAQRDQLSQALDRLEEALNLSPTRIHKDATIQRFEFCWELSWKLMQSMARFEGEECYSPRSCIRLAAKFGLIDSPERWFTYLEARNETTHTYNEETADRVYKTVQEFLPDARKLFDEVGNKLSETNLPPASS